MFLICTMISYASILCTWSMHAVVTAWCAGIASSPGSLDDPFQHMHSREKRALKKIRKPSLETRLVHRARPWLAGPGNEQFITTHGYLRIIQKMLQL